MEATLFSQDYIFKSRFQDFFKIYFPTIFLLISSFFIDYSNSKYFYLFTAIIIDAGHVYSTFVESWLDPSEIKKRFVVNLLLLSFFLNLTITYFFHDYLFYYIFYFTVYHNMRQGLGIMFLYKNTGSIPYKKLKWMYYFGTCFPFILFHFKKHLNLKLSEAILKNIDFTKYFSETSLNSIYLYGHIFYILVMLYLTWQIFNKNRNLLMGFIFFSSVYYISFMLLNSEIVAYGLLIFSHGIPYYFLMEKRVSLTHTTQFIRKNSHFFILAFFLIGGAFDYYQDDITDWVDSEFLALTMALLITPLIAHFLYDAVIWTNGHDKFIEFKKGMRQ